MMFKRKSGQRTFEGRASARSARDRDDPSAARSRPCDEPHLGNQQFQRLLERRVVQPKLTVNAPDDKYEREADRVAEAVMGMSSPNLVDNGQTGEVQYESVQRMCPRCHRRYRQGKALNCEECEEQFQRKEISERVPGVDGAVAGRIESVRGGGRPLPGSVRSFFEPRFGEDFSGVRIHSGPRADSAARAIGAEAVTIGRDIIFSKGNYQPDTTEGKGLLAHELTHVIQQNGAGGTTNAHEIGYPYDRFESEAARNAAHVVRGGSKTNDPDTEVSVDHSVARPKVQPFLSWITCPYYTWKYSATIDECEEEIRPYCGREGSMEDCLQLMGNYDASGITELVFKCAQEKESEALPKTLASCLSLSFGRAFSR